MNPDATKPRPTIIPPWGQLASPWAVLPAAGAAVVVLAVVFWWCRPVRRELLIQRYRSSLQAALSARDLPRAQVSARRLEQLTGYQPEARYQMGLVLDAQGKGASALEIMEELANSSAHRLPKAQLWLAKRMLAQSPQNAVCIAAARGQLEKMLDVSAGGGARASASRLSSAGAIGGGNQDVREARHLLAEIYRVAGEPAKAIPLLEATGDTDPKTLYTLAALHQSAGNSETARLWAQRTVRAASKLVPDTTRDATNRVWLARAHVLLDDFPAAAKALSGATGDREQTSLQEEFLSEVYCRWADHLAKGRPADPAEVLRLLLRSLEHSPVYPLTYTRLVELSMRQDQSRSQVAAALERVLVDKPADPTVHLLIGNSAWSDADHAGARRHYELALQAGPQVARIANNFAWAILNSERKPSELAAALELANRAVEKSPTDAEFRNTRGQVLVTLERWDEAVTDLEAAQPALPANRRLHQALLVAYRSLDNEPQAAMIQRILQGLDETDHDSGTGTIEAEISVPKVAGPAEANARD